MLEGLKRWLSGSGPDSKQGAARIDMAALQKWSRAPQLQIRTPREAEGVIIDGRSDDVAWRLEWGAPQRPYVLGHELRIRAELPLPGDLQLIVLNKVLQEAIEKTMFEQFVEGVQTRIDTETPAEMRWVVMYPKLKGTELGDLRDRFAAASNNTTWLQDWLGGPLGAGLKGLKIEPATALVLMIGRARVTLRTECEDPSPQAFEPMLRVFETALREARRVADAGHKAAPED